MAQEPGFASEKTYLKEALDSFTTELLREGHEPALLGGILVAGAYEILAKSETPEAAIETLQAMVDKARRLRRAERFARAPHLESLPPPLPWPPPKPPPQEDPRSQPRKGRA